MKDITISDVVKQYNYICYCHSPSVTNESYFMKIAPVLLLSFQISCFHKCLPGKVSTKQQIKSKFPLCLFMLLTTLSHAQQKLNLNFEQKSIEGIKRPWGWSIESGRSNRVEMDSLIKYEGSYSLRLQSAASKSFLEETVLETGIEAFEMGQIVKKRLFAASSWINFLY